MADFSNRYGTYGALTVTNLHSLATSSTWLSGWTSDWIDNTTDLAPDVLVDGKFVAGTSPTGNPGDLRVYAYAKHLDGSAPDLFSAGTEGTQGTATVHDSEMLDASLVLVWSSATDTTSGDVYTMPARSLRAAFGGTLPPVVALFVTHSMGVNMASSGNFVNKMPVWEQY